MPLHGQNKMFGRSAFESFDDTVFLAVGDHAKAIADFSGGLVVAGVGCDLGGSCYLSKFRFWINYNLVSVLDFSSCLVIDQVLLVGRQKLGNMLNQCPAAVDV